MKEFSCLTDKSCVSLGGCYSAHTILKVTKVYKDYTPNNLRKGVIILINYPENIDTMTKKYITDMDISELETIFPRRQYPKMTVSYTKENRKYIVRGLIGVGADKLSELTEHRFTSFVTIDLDNKMCVQVSCDKI